MLRKKKGWKNGHFWTKTMGQPLWKNVKFSSFWTSCFYSLERRFFDLEYHKRHFTDLYCQKKKVRKMAIFGPKPRVNQYGKMLIFLTFWTSSFYSLEKRLFVLEYHKTHFPDLCCLKKKNCKNAHFRTKTMG